MTMQVWEGDLPKKQEKHHVRNTILYAMLFALLYFIGDRIYDEMQYEYPPRDVAPRAYKTVHVIRFESTVCWKCHKP